MPLCAALDPLALIIGGFLVEFVMLDGTDGADLRVTAAQLSLRVQDRMDMELGRLGLSRQLPETLDQLFLDVVIELVLLPEEDDPALGDCHVDEYDIVRR
jgi:hypothetical protein